LAEHRSYSVEITNCKLVVSIFLFCFGNKSRRGCPYCIQTETAFRGKMLHRIQRFLHRSIRSFLAKHVTEFILVKHLNLDLRVPVFLTLRIMSFMTVANLSSLLARRDGDCQIFRRFFTENCTILLSLFPFLFRYYGGCILGGKKRHYSNLRRFKLTFRE